jgi:lipopolysaccharide biosynthesis glycosyltransferase
MYTNPTEFRIRGVLRCGLCDVAALRVIFHFREDSKPWEQRSEHRNGELHCSLKDANITESAANDEKKTGHKFYTA